MTAGVSLLEQAIRADFQILTPRTPDVLGDKLCIDYLKNHHLQLVYTAFDGDHFALTERMRELVLAEGKVPVNPESILGYKDLVDHHLLKRPVLEDDLALLQSADELWLYTDLEAHPDSLPMLAEGAVLELLYFRSVHPTRSVTFVQTRCLFDSPPNPHTSMRRYEYDLEESLKGLHQDQVEGLRRLLERSVSEAILRPVEYFIIDPLDTKYARWLRAWAYSRGVVPMVPQLAVTAAAVTSTRGHPIGCLIASWAELRRTSVEAWFLPPSVAGRGEARSATMLRELWDGTAVQKHRALDWATVKVPKVALGPRWPLTRHEGGL